MTTKLILIFPFLFLASISHAHEGHKKKKQDSTKADTTKLDSLAHEHFQGDTVHHHEEGMKPDESEVTADFDDFPSLHPLIVHFVIVLIIIAAALQLLNIYLLKNEIAWITTAILLAGVLAAWLAAKNFHPHTHGISEHAKLVLDQHDRWADWTINSGIVAALLQIANLFVFKGKRWAAAVVGVVLIVSTYSVSRAGHYGSQLVHIEGIGPQGKFLEIEHHH